MFTVLMGDLDNRYSQDGKETDNDRTFARSSTIKSKVTHHE